MGQGAGYREQVLDPMAHLAGKQFVSFFGLFAARDIQENAEHDALDNAGVSALAAGRNPTDLPAQDDPKVDLIGSRDGAGGDERGPHPVTIGGVDMARER